MKTKQLVIDAMLVAVYYVLSSYLSVNLGGLRVTLDVLPVAVAAALFGPVNGLVVGFVGNFLFQLAGPYGISVTTVLWALPDAARDAWMAWYASTPDTPCIAICSTSQGDDLCKGCGRTFDEVQHWPAMGPAAKRQVWRRITLEHTAWRFTRYAERAAEGASKPPAV